MTEFIEKTCLALIICGNHEDDHVEWSELIQAIEQAQTKEMLRILNKDPQLIYITDMVGETALHAVARAGHPQTASKIMQFIGSRDKVLLKKNIDGETALHLALKNRHQETAYHLVDLFRMTVSLVNNDGVSPRDLAEEAGYSDVLGVMSFRPCAAIADIEMTLVRRDIIDFDESQRKWIGNIGCMRLSNVKDAFFQSAFGVKWERLWLEMDRFGGNLLHIAARLDRVDLLKLVVQFMTSDELGSLPFERNKDDDTALDLALKAKHKNAAMYLIELAPKCSYLLNRFGVSPLYRTIELGDEDLVRYIFQLMPGNAMDSSTRKSLLKAKMSVVHAAVKSRNSLGIPLLDHY